MLQGILLRNGGDAYYSGNMKIEEIIQLATNKKNSLVEKKNLSYMSGDMDSYYKIEEEILEVEKILEKLNS
jgi:hypothetical protein